MFFSKSKYLSIRNESKYDSTKAMLELREENLSNIKLSSVRIRQLIFGRLGLIFLLLLAVWWWKNSFLGLPADDFPNGLFVLFLVAIGLSFLYFAVLKTNENYHWQARIQFVIDVFLISGLVWGTGDLLSPYVTLYIVLVGVSAFFLGNRGTLFVAGLSAFCFALLPILASQSISYSFSGETRPSRLLQAVGFNTVAILVVGLLAARFSERRKVDEKIIEAAESFADLHILHERIVASIHSGLITTDLEGRIYAFNRTAELISGLNAEQMIGKNILSIFGEKIHKPIRACLDSVKSTEFIPEHFEAELLADSKHETENRVTIACSVSPLFGKNGGTTGLILTFQDITQIRTMEESLRRSDRLTAVGRMAAGLAHEIRNPLGSMSSALQFLQEKIPAASDEASLVKVVLRESDRLNRIISNFLTYARPSPDLFSGERNNEMDLGEAIEDCLLLLRHNPEVNELHEIEFTKPETAICVQANETQLKQIFWNLSKNAVQAMPTGGKLSVGLKEVSEKQIQIIFDDTGQGINPSYLEHLFEPFSSQAKGTGLGLSIVHRIVTDHNGKIDVQSGVGKGTKITIELPRVAE